MSQGQKCPCSMTALELLQQHIDLKKPVKSMLIIDNGNGWNVTMFGPDAAGLGTDHITLQSAVEEVEDRLVNLRRQSNVESKDGEVITDPVGVARALGAGR